MGQRPQHGNIAGIADGCRRFPARCGQGLLGMVR
jgi:hypothetical protein